MAFRTVAGAVQDYLQAELSSRLPAVPCSVGYPAGGLAREQVWVSTEFEAEMLRTVSGFGGRDEQGSVEVRVSVVESSDRGGDPRDRALEVVGTVEDLIRSDPTLSGVCVTAQVARIRGQEAIPDEHERQYGVALTITYLATVSAA